MTSPTASGSGTGLAIPTAARAASMRTSFISKTWKAQVGVSMSEMTTWVGGSDEQKQTVVKKDEMKHSF